MVVVVVGGGHHISIKLRRGGHLLFTWSIGGRYRNFDLSNIFFPPPPCIDKDWSVKMFFFELVLECLQAQSEAPPLLLCKFIK